LCGIRTHDPVFRASEDSSCLRPTINETEKSALCSKKWEQEEKKKQRDEKGYSGPCA
jgi:hypothetical protein